MSTDPKKDYTNLGRVFTAHTVKTPFPSETRTRTIILLLAGSVALMMTGFGIIMPVFARRLGELGGGVADLGLMTVAFAISQFIFAPLLGTLADKIGRRPLILLAIGSFIIVNIGYLLADSIWQYILVRGAGGAFTAGLFPAAMGVVADIVPENRRARWIGMVMAGYGVGFIFGPALGGVLYDGFGFAAPFITSAVLAVFALIAAFILIPETRPAVVRRRMALRNERLAAHNQGEQRGWRQSLPQPLWLFGLLLYLDFVGAFAFAFIEPEMVFYMYDELGWSTARFGVIVGVYGLAMVLGQTLLGQSSDRIGRKPIILIGIALNTTLYIGLIVLRDFGALALVAAVSGLGAALIAPALSAFYLDITTEAHRGRVVGIKEAALALGGIIGPLLVVVISPLASSAGVFAIAGVLMAVSGVMALFWLKEPRRLEAAAPPEKAWEISEQRSMAAQATLQGIAMWAQNARDPKMARRD